MSASPLHNEVRDSTPVKMQAYRCAGFRANSYWITNPITPSGVPAHRRVSAQTSGHTAACLRAAHGSFSSTTLKVRGACQRSIVARGTIPSPAPRATMRTIHRQNLRPEYASAPAITAVQCLFFQVHRQCAVGRQADIRVAQRGRETQPVLLRQGMVERDHQHQWVIAKRHGLQVLGVDGVRNDPDVASVLTQRVVVQFFGSLLLNYITYYKEEYLHSLCALFFLHL